MDTRPVVVGVDGSDDSLQALRWGADYAQRFDAPLHAVAVYDVPRVYGPMAMTGFQDAQELEKSYQAMLKEAVGSALGSEAQVTERVERGHPARNLIQASRDAQLLVLGSRGHGGFVGMLLGSVSQHCVAQARCPVIVMPHDAKGTAEKQGQ